MDEEWITSPAFSIVQSVYEPEWESRLIMNDDKIIGFVFYGLWEKKNAPLLCRYMIDVDYQGKGYGQAALPVIVNEMMKQYKTDKIYLTLEKANERAVHIYTKFGFVPTGEIDEGEDIYLYEKSKEQTSIWKEAYIKVPTLLCSRLKELQDLKYRDMQIRIIPIVDPESIIGVRTPELKRIAKEILKSGDYAGFLRELPHKYFEEHQLHAFIISGMKDFDECMAELENFLPYIDNWATCDQMSPKIFKKHKVFHDYFSRFGFFKRLYHAHAGTGFD